MTFCTDDLQTSGCSGHLVQLDICTTAGHVGGNGHIPGFTGMGYDLRLFLVELGVQYLMRDSLSFQHTA